MPAAIDPEKHEDEETSTPKPGLVQRVRDYKLYPRAHEAHLSIHDPAIRTSRLALLRAAFKNFVFLQLLFFALFCYIFGGLYKETKYIHHLNVVFVDYDGGAIGGSIRSAYQALQKDSFLTIQEKLPADYPDPSELRREICKANYWGAFYISPGSSDALQRALAGETQDYNKSAIMQYIWNEARYSTIVDSGVSSNLQLLSNTAKPIYASQANWSSIITSPDDITYSTFANPWVLISNNIQPTMQGARLVYNTLVVILLMIQEFFYLGTLNQLYENFKIYTHLNPHRIIFFRNMISITYCFVGSLCVTGTIWIFKSGWHVNGSQFVLTWMALWLYAHLNFLTLDVFTVWLPPPFVPMALITWLMLNVASILLPLELMSDFYRWSYAMPAHELYNVLIDIWSGGCNPVLRYSLPILFSYEVSSFILSALGIHRRCHYAIIRAEAEASAFNERLEAALAFEKKKRAEEKAKFERRASIASTKRSGEEGVEEGRVSRTSSEIRAEEAAEDRKEERDARAELKGLIEDDQLRLRKLQSINFGPSFGFGLTAGNQDDDDGGSAGRTRSMMTFPRKRSSTIG